MKKVLIITYYWPPSGGSGVQRWLKFSKYLPSNGWQPIIYTPSNPEAIAIDESLLAEIPPEAVVIKHPITEPYALYKKLTGKKGSASTSVNPINNVGKKSFMESLSLWIRANCFVPDPRIAWLRTSVRFLKKYLDEHPVDAIVSTGPPHSMHLIARKIHNTTGIRWIADFRDPWTRIFYFKHLPMLECVSKRQSRQELSVLLDADAVVTVNRKMKKEMEETISNGGGKTPVYTISNGYDEADYQGTPPEPESSFTLTHIGLFSAEGNPTMLWKVLSELSSSNASFKKDLKIRLIGKVDAEIIKSIADAGLEENLINMGYLPHSEIAAWQQKARVLLLPTRNEPEAAGIVTGKFFEYLAARRPIIAFGPKLGDLGLYLKDTASGTIFEWDDEDSLKEEVQKQYIIYLESFDASKKNIPIGNETIITNYSRKELTAQFAELL